MHQHCTNSWERDTCKSISNIVPIVEEEKLKLQIVVAGQRSDTCKSIFHIVLIVEEK